MFRKTYQVLDAGEVRASMGSLIEQVAKNHQRVIITHDGARCVLISQAELQGLERALEILFGTNDVAAMHAEVLRIAAEVEEQRVPAATLS